MTRNFWAATGAILIVAAAIVSGFWSLGTPRWERESHQDLRTVQALQGLAVDIYKSWKVHKTMPNLEDFVPEDETRDPTTHAQFIYRPKQGTTYELCAIFLTSDHNDTQSEAAFWHHAKGEYCFQLDASQSVPVPPLVITPY